MKELILFEKQPITKQGIKSLVAEIVEYLKDGNTNNLLFAVQLKALEDTIKELRANLDIKDLSLTEALKYSEKTFDYKGAKIEIAEVGVTYDYANCDDSEWNDLQIELENIKSKIKGREMFLKTLTKPYASETTEGVFINPPIKKSSTGIKITLK